MLNNRTWNILSFENVVDILKHRLIKYLGLIPLQLAVAARLAGVTHWCDCGQELFMTQGLVPLPIL